MSVPYGVAEKEKGKCGEETLKQQGPAVSEPTRSPKVSYNASNEKIKEITPDKICLDDDEKRKESPTSNIAPHVVRAPSQEHNHISVIRAADTVSVEKTVSVSLSKTTDSSLKTLASTPAEVSANTGTVAIQNNSTNDIRVSSVSTTKGEQVSISTISCNASTLAGLTQSVSAPILNSNNTVTSLNGSYSEVNARAKNIRLSVPVNGQTMNGMMMQQHPYNQVGRNMQHPLQQNNLGLQLQYQQLRNMQQGMLPVNSAMQFQQMQMRYNHFQNAQARDVHPFMYQALNANHRFNYNRQDDWQKQFHLNQFHQSLTYALGSVPNFQAAVSEVLAALKNNYIIEKRKEMNRERNSLEKRKKKQQKQKKKGKKKAESETQQTKEWVQCELCMKWHELPSNIHAEDLPDTWYCEMGKSWGIKSCRKASKRGRKSKKEKKEKGKVGRPALKKTYLASPNSGGEQMKWVQCDEEKCKKYRKIPFSEKVGSKWNCSMNSDPLRNTCSAEEEEHDADLKSLKKATAKKRGRLPSSGRGTPGRPPGKKNKTDPSSSNAKQAKNKDGPKKDDATNFKWVQCDTCQTWRRIPGHVDMSKLPEKWYCAMNEWDPLRATCTAPQEKDPNQQANLNGKGPIIARGSKGINEEGRSSYMELIPLHYKHRNAKQCGLGPSFIERFCRSSLYISKPNLFEPGRKHKNRKNRSWRRESKGAKLLPYTSVYVKKMGEDLEGPEIYTDSCESMIYVNKREKRNQKIRTMIINILSHRKCNLDDILKIAGGQASVFKDEISFQLNFLSEKGLIVSVSKDPSIGNVKESEEVEGVTYMLSNDWTNCSAFAPLPLKLAKPWKTKLKKFT